MGCSECGEPLWGRNLCQKHYFRRRRAGTLPPPLRDQAQTEKAQAVSTFTDEHGLPRIVGLPQEHWELERLVGVLEWLAEAREDMDVLVPGEKREVTIRDYITDWQVQLADIAEQGDDR